MVGKRLELLRDAVPGFSRVGVILAPDYATADGTLKALHPAAHGWGLQARVYEVRSGSRVGSRIRGGCARWCAGTRQAISRSSGPSNSNSSSTSRVLLSLAPGRTLVAVQNSGNTLAGIQGNCRWIAANAAARIDTLYSSNIVDTQGVATMLHNS
jgi:hypothetical protein